MTEESAELVEPVLSNTRPLPAGNSVFVAMRHRNYQLYFGGQLISNIGTWMQIIAQAWVVYQIGHSELTLGLVAFASAIPDLDSFPMGWRDCGSDVPPQFTDDDPIRRDDISIYYGSIDIYKGNTGMARDRSCCSAGRGQCI